MIQLLLTLWLVYAHVHAPDTQASPAAAGADSLSYRYYQSAVKALHPGPQPMPYAVCDLMETFVGLPAQLDPAPVVTAMYQTADIKSSAAFMQYTLEEVGLMAVQDSGAYSSDADLTHYHCPKGTVLSWQEPGRLAPNKIVSLLQQGIKGIVVAYDYCPRDWKKGNWHLDRVGKRHRIKGAHAVLIVGYQDSSFIFKNNWSAAWGDGGYGLMSFDYHRQHVREGLVAYLAEAVEPQTDQIAGISIKVQPEMLDGQQYLQVSIVATGAGKLPQPQQLDFTLTCTRFKPEVAKSLLLANARSTGYPCLLKVHDPAKPLSLDIRYRLEPDGDPQALLFDLQGWENAQLLPRASRKTGP